VSDRKRILDKIGKLLNLGKDARGNANECAAALRQAQKLMDKHGVTQAELGLVGYSKETVECPIQVSKKTIPLRLSLLVHIIADAFGVKPIIGSTKRQSDYSYVVHYIGPSGRVMLAVYSHTVVQRALDAAWRKYLALHPEIRGMRGVRAGFESGWLEEVRNSVQELGFTEEERAATNALIEKEFTSLVKHKTNVTSVDALANADGAAAGAEFRLSRPVSKENLKIGG
jgi:hypothetical protein